MTTVHPQIPFSNTFISMSTSAPPAQIPLTTTPNKSRLRSCLSPSRSSSITPYEDSSVVPTPSGSRSTSFSSCASEGWKRTKCVRWQEMNGCAVTSTHDTYSHEEYDRTPLEPPSIAERECVLPERGSRCLSLSRDCFLSDSESYLDDEDNDEDTSADSYFLNTPPPTETCSEDGDADADEHQEKEHWEECMDRRRRMFAMMCPQLSGGCSPEDVNGDRDRHPEFEGYKSISATLANLLRSVHSQEDDNDEEEEGEEEGMVKTECGFGFTSLLNVRQERDIPEIDTPSLVSESDGLEEDECLQSPGGSNSGNSTVIPGQPILCTEELVLAAWSRGRQRKREQI
ncbi:hypothetical protein I302_102257 [Kwoniella bestiolae CBS 10118]|uniref:Uncharacterized protein n=1 Tax=Kwoniella bestiolae CBS 10118 TaxID=1296100 RepID=A0A1B9GEP9_9TREE|nr:hypothetical protein I302_00946 [Kwoniella bestiolae CBS 10118]OCF29441.1 hypothetical protein I302_00946 [Kwoniella bestiolae CBS 10118]